MSAKMAVYNPSCTYWRVVWLHAIITPVLELRSVSSSEHIHQAPLPCSTKFSFKRVETVEIPARMENATAIISLPAGR